MDLKSIDNIHNTAPYHDVFGLAGAAGPDQLGDCVCPGRRVVPGALGGQRADDRRDEELARLPGAADGQPGGPSEVSPSVIAERIILELRLHSGEKKNPKMTYSSSLTDQEWEIIEPLLPKKKN